MSTPRTDKKAVSHIGFYSCETVPASLARELEIETQQLQAERDALREALKRLADELCESENNARAALARRGI